MISYILFSFLEDRDDASVTAPDVNAVPTESGVPASSTRLRSFIKNVMYAGLFTLSSVFGCGESNPVNGGDKPTPPAQNSSIDVIVDLPESYSWDMPRQKQFSASHPDGFSEGFVEFYVNGSLVWSIDASSRSSIDTTWTQGFDLDSTPMDFTADLELRYNLVDAFERAEDRNSVSGSDDVAVTRSPYTEFPLFVQSRFSGEGLDGSVTFPNGSVVSVADGEGFVSRDLQVLYDAVRSNSLRILAEMQDSPVHSSLLRVGDDDQVRPVVVTPYEYGPFELTSVQDRFLHETRHQDFVSGMTTERWKPNTTITALFYDMSYFDGQTGEFVQSDDKTKITAPGFIDNAITALKEVVSMIPEDQNISLDIKIESEDMDFSFPREYDISDDNPYMYFSGRPQAPFFLTRSNALDGAYIRNATLMHSSGFEGSYELDAPGSVRSDVIENFGVRTTGHDRDLLDLNTSRSEYNALTPLVVDYVYSSSANTGRVELKSSGLPNSSGSQTTVIEDWVHDW